MSSATLLGVAGCGFGIVGPTENEAARLTARPHAPSGSIEPGTYKLELGSTRDGYLVVPASYDPKTPMPLLVALHGATGGGAGPVNLWGHYPDERGFILLAPDSRGFTWDAMQRGFGVDIEFIDRALNLVFDRCNVDANRIFIEGFSDGASYALGVGPSNPELFKRVIAFSPGFITAYARPVNGFPQILVSHGRQDAVLGFSNTEGSIVPALYSAGFRISFLPFEGEHQVPADILRQAVDWMLSPLAPPE